MNFLKTEILFNRIWRSLGVIFFFILLTEIVCAKGPGIDGGGGVSILSVQNEVRFWDAAQSESVRMQEFTDEQYFKILLSDERYVRRTSTPIRSKDFFSCGINKIKQSGNILLESAVDELFSLEIVETSLPLDLFATHNWSIDYKSDTQWVYSLDIQNIDLLYTKSIDKKFQRPIAAFALQSTNGLYADYFIPTLIVQKQLYKKLNDNDKCALQIHELLRWIADDNNYKLTKLFSRQLTQPELERMTEQLNNRRSVKLIDVPASGLLYLKTIKNLQSRSWFESKMTKQESDILISEVENLKKSIPDLNEAKSGLILREMIYNTQQATRLAEIGILEISNSDAKKNARNIINANSKNQSDEWVDLCSLVPEDKFIHTRCLENH